MKKFIIFLFLISFSTMALTSDYFINKACEGLIHETQCLRIMAEKIKDCTYGGKSYSFSCVKWVKDKVNHCEQNIFFVADCFESIAEKMDICNTYFGSEAVIKCLRSSAEKIKPCEQTLWNICKTN